MAALLYALVLFPLADSAVASKITQRAPVDVLKWVNPLIGTNSGGNVFAGATLPYGMAKGM
jgi:putative alpha-1,2-mannosidase